MLTPQLYQVKSITHDSSDVFTLQLKEKESGKGMKFSPGQFNMLYLFGFGEVAISISGDPSRQDTLVHTIRAAGSVTKKMQQLRENEEIIVRGPFGSKWPSLKRDCDLLLIAGGVGIAAFRSLLFELAVHQDQYRNLTLLYGVKRPDEIIYKEELDLWQKQGINIEIIVDSAGAGWKGHVGVVTSLIVQNLKDCKNTLVFMCGPEVMIRYAVQEVVCAQVEEHNIFISLERNMQCAVGFCGHCLYGPYFICKDGPILSYAQLKHWLRIREL